MTEISKPFSIITSNVNGFNSSIKTYGLDDWLQKQDPIVYLF